MHQARAQDLNVDPHRIHVGEAPRDIAHPIQHQHRAIRDCGSHLLRDTGVARQLGENIVLGCHRIDLRNDDMSVEIDRARALPSWRMARHPRFLQALHLDTIVP